MFVAEMHRRGPGLFGLDRAGTAVEAKNVFIGRIFDRITVVVMATGALAACVIIVALETDPHHDVLVLDIRLLGVVPDAGTGVVGLLVAGMTLAGLLVGQAGDFLHVAVIGTDYGRPIRPFGGCRVGAGHIDKLRRHGLTGVVTGQALALGTGHMAVNAFPFEPFRKLLMLPQAEDVVRVIVIDGVVVTVPAGVVAGEVGSRIPAHRIAPGAGIPAMAGRHPVGQVDFGVAATRRDGGVHIAAGGAVAVLADDLATDRPSPDRVNAVLVAGGVGT